MSITYLGCEMMNDRRKMVIVILISGILWFSLVIIEGWTILEVINRTFMTGMVGLLGGVIIMIVTSGFMDPIFSGFRKISFGLNKSNAMKRVDEEMAKNATIQNMKNRFKKVTLTIVLSFSTTSLLISFVSLIIYYR